MSEQPEARVYSVSVKIDQSVKGAATVTVHVYSNDDDDAVQRAINDYMATIEQLKEKGVPVASEVTK